MRWPQDCGTGSLGKKRPLASQRPKSREETPKEGGGNAGRATARGIHVIWRHKMQEANQRLLTYSRTFFFWTSAAALPSPNHLANPAPQERKSRVGDNGRVRGRQPTPPGSRRRLSKRPGEISKIAVTDAPITEGGPNAHGEAPK
jgi:hypothetical protein